MRLWSLHSRYLDSQGLVALWREALLAQAVLRGETRGYRHHPQLERFKNHPTPLAALSRYLEGVHAEATSRGYNFAKDKIKPTDEPVVLSVTEGQLAYEWTHLLAKLKTRQPDLYLNWLSVPSPDPHPLFSVCSGDIEAWERITT